MTQQSAYLITEYTVNEKGNGQSLHDLHLREIISVLCFLVTAVYRMKYGVHFQGQALASL